MDQSPPLLPPPHECSVDWVLRRRLGLLGQCQVLLSSLHASLHYAPPLASPPFSSRTATWQPLTRIFTLFLESLGAAARRRDRSSIPFTASTSRPSPRVAKVASRPPILRYAVRGFRFAPSVLSFSRVQWGLSALPALLGNICLWISFTGSLLLGFN